jgi:GNAT superfamily N-acetyltransferase
MEVVALLVREELRGGGIGAALLDRCEKWALTRGCKLLMLSSQLFRERAHAFYRRQGFREVKRSAFFVKEL